MGWRLREDLQILRREPTPRFVSQLALTGCGLNNKPFPNRIRFVPQFRERLVDDRNVGCTSVVSSTERPAAH